MQLQKFQGIDPHYIDAVIVSGDLSPLIDFIDKEKYCDEEAVFEQMKGFVISFLKLSSGALRNMHNVRQTLVGAFRPPGKLKSTEFHILSFTSPSQASSFLESARDFDKDLEKVIGEVVFSLITASDTFMYFSLSKDYRLRYLGFVNLPAYPGNAGCVLMSVEHETMLIDKLNASRQLSLPGSLNYCQLRRSVEGYDVTSNRMNNTREIKLDHELYPFLEVSPEEFLDGFMASTSTILFLLGDPGSGKSSLLRHLAKSHTVDVIDDSRAFSGDGVPAITNRIMSAEPRVFAFEEIEADLRDRSNSESPFIKSLLQVSSGIVKTESKIVICLNHVTEQQLDSALMRPDRCYGVVKFRKLTAAEATKASAVLGLNHVYTESVSLADVFSGPVQGVKKQAFGFAAA